MHTRMRTRTEATSGTAPLGLAPRPLPTGVSGMPFDAGYCQPASYPVSKHSALSCGQPEPAVPPGGPFHILPVTHAPIPQLGDTHRQRDLPRGLPFWPPSSPWTLSPSADFLTSCATVSRGLTGGEIVAILFGVLLAVALLLGVVVCRSRCCSCSSPVTILGPSVWAEAPEYSPGDPPIP